MDNPATESSTEALNQDQAAEEFAKILSEPEQEEQPAEQEEPAQEAEESAGDDPLVTIKVDGKEIQVPLSEVKAGYQRQADYTRKTMEVSEQRKAAEAEIAQAQAERQAYAVNLQKMQAQIEGALQSQQNIDWQQLLESNPQEYLRQKHLFEQRQAALQQNLASQQQIAAQMQAEHQRAFLTNLQSQQQELIAKLPEWKDEAKAKAEKVAIRDYLLSQGYDQSAVANVVDHRAVLIARKAMLYDQMVSKASAATKRVGTLPTKVERPGNTAPTLDKRTSAYQRLSKSGRVEDAAAVFASLL